MLGNRAQLIQQKVVCNSTTGGGSQQPVTPSLPGMETRFGGPDIIRLQRNKTLFHELTNASRPRAVKKQRCSGTQASQGTMPTSAPPMRTKRKRSVAGLDLRVVLKCHGCHTIMGGGYKFGDYVQCTNCGENEFIVIKEWSPNRENRTSNNGSGCVNWSIVNCMADHNSQR